MSIEEEQKAVAPAVEAKDVVEEKEEEVAEEQEQESKPSEEEATDSSEEKPKLSKEDYLKIQKETDARSVFVGNVDYSSTNEELHDFFKPVGEINRVTILRDRFSGHPKGFAYVEFASVESIPKALELSGSEFKGRPLDVTPKRTNIPGFSYKGYRNYYNNNYRGGAHRGGAHRGGSYRGRGGSYRGSRGSSRGRGGFRQPRRYDYHNEPQQPQQAPAISSEEPAPAPAPTSTPAPEK